jgi:hypothetical protein
MKNGTTSLTTKLQTIVLNRLSGKEDSFYFADENAVWRIGKLVANPDATCGIAFECSVWSVYGNSAEYQYDDKEDFIFTKEDKYKFYDFDHQEQADIDRANIIIKMMSTAKWLNDEDEDDE